METSTEATKDVLEKDIPYLELQMQEVSWTEHPLPTSETGTADTWNAEEAQVEVDSEGNIHAMWMGLDDMPYWSYSRDQGDTWSNATMIALQSISREQASR